MSACIECGRKFISASRPQWAFDADLRLEGKVHATCATRWRVTRRLGREYVQSRSHPEMARRNAWLELAPKKTAARTDIWFCSTARERERHLAWWKSSQNPCPLI